MVVQSRTRPTSNKKSVTAHKASGHKPSPLPVKARPREEKQVFCLKFVVLYTLAYLGLWVALMTPINVTLALRIEQIAPPASKSEYLSIVMGIGALVAMLANPLAGQLSDRTTSRFGMRKPWMVGGTIIAAIGLFLMAIGDFTLIVFGWCLVQLGFNFLLATLVPLLAEQVPENYRGRISGILGICLPAGNMLGVAIVDLLNGSMVAMFMGPMVFCAITVFAFALYFKDRRQDAAGLPPLSVKQFFANFFIDPREEPDFAWAFLSRFMFYVGLGILTTYSVFYYMDTFHVKEGQVPSLMLKTMIANSTGAILGSLVTGWLADYMGRRKIFVMGAAAVFAIGLGIIAMASSIDIVIIGSGIAGYGSGVYLAIDLALVTAVLPSGGRDIAKNMGVFNIASTIPQSIAPMIGSVVLPIHLGIGLASKSQQDYTLLFIVAAIAVLLSALSVVPIRKSR